MIRKSILIWTGIVVVASLGVAYYFAREARIASAKAAAMATKISALKSEANQLGKLIASAHSVGARSLSQHKPKPLARRASAYLDFRSQMAHDPKLEALQLAMNRARIVQNYGPLFQKLHLSSDQISKFEEIVAQHASQIADIRDTAVADGLSPSDPAIRALTQQANRDYQKQEQQLLGDSGYQDTQAYERTLAARLIVAGLAGNVAFTDPISPAQGDQLTQAIAEASQSYQKGGAVVLPTIDFDQVTQAAQGILTPSQMTAWEQIDTGLGSQKSWMLSQIIGAVSHARAAPNNAGNTP
jgi:hypothetical protein